MEFFIAVNLLKYALFYLKHVNILLSNLYPKLIAFGIIHFLKKILKITLKFYCSFLCVGLTYPKATEPLRGENFLFTTQSEGVPALIQLTSGERKTELNLQPPSSSNLGSLDWILGVLNTRLLLHVTFNLHGSGNIRKKKSTDNVFYFCYYSDFKITISSVNSMVLFRQG